MLGANGTVLSYNLFVYCENNVVNNVDYYGYWCEDYAGFKKNSKGFNVNVNTKFLSRTFCMLYAAEFLAEYGSGKWCNKKYSGMNTVRIAQELWFHALAYYVGKPMQTVLKWCNIEWEGLNYKVYQAGYIEVNSDDNRAWIFKLVWNSSTKITYTIGCVVGTTVYTKLIK